MGHAQADYSVEILWPAGPFNPEDDNVDVYVHFITGKRLFATFFAAENIYSIMDRYRSTGECLHGEYLWSSAMMVVRHLGEDSIRKTIEDLIVNREIDDAFDRVDDSGE